MKKQTPWHKQTKWKIVWHLGWFIKPLKNLYISKIRSDPDYAKDI